MRRPRSPLREQRDEREVIVTGDDMMHIVSKSANWHSPKPTKRGVEEQMSESMIWSEFWFT
jgi:hypothetical protein